MPVQKTDDEIAAQILRQQEQQELEAKAKEIDLIVMGTHGKSGLKSVLMGSVTERVIGHAPCAVLVTPA